MPGTWPVDGWTDGGQGTDCSLSCQPGQVSYPEWQAGNLPISSKLGLGQLNSVDVSCLFGVVSDPRLGSRKHLGSVHICLSV